MWFKFKVHQLLIDTLPPSSGWRQSWTGLAFMKDFLLGLIFTKNQEKEFIFRTDYLFLPNILIFASFQGNYRKISYYLSVLNSLKHIPDRLVEGNKFWTYERKEINRIILTLNWYNSREEINKNKISFQVQEGERVF